MVADMEMLCYEREVDVWKIFCVGLVIVTVNFFFFFV